MASTGELQVRISPRFEVVVDLDAVLGNAGAEAVERALYVEVGTPKWRLVSTA